LKYFNLSKEEVEIDAENQNNKAEVTELVKKGKHRDRDTGEIIRDARFKDQVDLD
jgi:hypothetical protein